MFDQFIIDILKFLDKWSFGIKDKIFFFKELSYLLAGGISIVDALQLIRQTTESYALKEIIEDMLYWINTGKPFSYCLSRQPDFFDEWDSAIVRSWEKTWNLSQVMKSLSHEYEFITGIQNKYYGALMYPAVLTVISIGAIVIMFLYILPGIFQILLQFDGVEIPPLTQILIYLTHFFQAYIGSISIGLGIFIVLIVVFLSTEYGKILSLNILMNIPIFGKLTKYYYLIKFCRYTKIMLFSGMNYVDSFKLLKDILWIGAYKKLLENVIQWLHKGKTIYDSIKYDVDVMPSNVMVLMKVGEETANLPQALDNVVSMYEEELNNMLTNLSKVIEPILIVWIGLIVVVIALAVFGVIGNILSAVSV